MFALWMFVGSSLAAEPPGSIRGKVAMPVGARDDTWAWIDGDGPLPATPATAEMAQRGIAFDPPLLVVPKGTIVAFPNKGPEQHNVYWVTRESSVDLGTYRVGETRHHSFDEEGLYPIGCNRHSAMSAIIRVVPNVWVVQVDPRGTFELTGVPPGTWHVVVWSPHQNASVERDVVVHPGRASDFTAALD